MRFHHLNRLTRRDFLRLGALGLGSAIVAACGGQPITNTPLATIMATLTPEQQQALATTLPTLATLTPEQILQMTATASPTATLTATPTATGTPTATPTATEVPPTATPELRLAETLREGGRRIGLEIGNTVGVDDYHAWRSDYAERQRRHFGATFATNVIFDRHISAYGTEGLEIMVKNAREGDMDLVVSNCFWSPEIPTQLQDLPQDSQLRPAVERNMRERLGIIFRTLKAGKGKRPVYFGGNHEAIDLYQARLTWTDDVYYRAFGEDLFAATAEIEMHEATKAGLTPGQDIFFMIGVTGCMAPGPLLTSTVELIASEKARLAQKLGIPANQVPLGILAEGHVVQSGTMRGHDPVPTGQQIVDAAAALAAVGPVVFTEVEVQRASASQVADYWSNVVKAAHATGVKGVILWPGLRDCIAQPEELWCNPNGALLTVDGKPTTVYDALLGTLNSLAS